MGKGTVFNLNSAQCCRHLGAEKWYFNGKRVGFHNSDKNAVIRGKNAN